MEDLKKALEDLEHSDESEKDIRGRGIVATSIDNEYEAVLLCDIHLCNGVKIRKPKSIIVEGDLIQISVYYIPCRDDLMESLKAAEAVKGPRRWGKGRVRVGPRGPTNVDEMRFLAAFLGNRRNELGKTLYGGRTFGVLGEHIVDAINRGHALFLRKEEIIIYYKVFPARHTEQDLNKVHKPPKHMRYFPIDQHEKAAKGIEKMLKDGEHRFMNFHNIRMSENRVLLEFVRHVIQSVETGR